MAKIPETTKEWLQRYEQKRDKAYRNYQDTGDGRYDRQYYEYDVICDALQARLELKEERAVDIKKRMANRDWVIGTLVKNKYSKDEVIKMLQDAVYW